MCALSRYRLGDATLFAVTALEIVYLVRFAPSFTATDWIYLLQHILVLALALIRRPPEAIDRSALVTLTVIVAYAYPYAAIVALRWLPSAVALPRAGLVLVIVAACLSLASVAALGRSFGIFPALRGLVTRGPYRLVRHPMYLAYLISDVGLNLQQWNLASIVLTVVGWTALVFRIYAEERVLGERAAWNHYASLVRYRLVPGLW